MVSETGNGNGNDAPPKRELIGVTALAEKIGKSKGTVSKQAHAGKIPVAEFTEEGAPLFDLEEVLAAGDDNLNPNMRRGDDDGAEAGDDRERRSPGRSPSGLTAVMIEERQVRTRSLQLKQAADEGLLVIAAEVERERTTEARATRDSVTQYVADCDGKAYAFAAKQPTQAQWRHFLISIVRDAYAERERALAEEADDELDDDSLDGEGAGSAEPAGTA